MSAELALGIIGSATGIVSAFALVASAVRDRQRLRLRLGVIREVDRPALVYIDVHNDGPRATTVTEVGLFAMPVVVKVGQGDDAVQGRAEVSFKLVDGLVSFAPDETKRFAGSCPDVDQFGIHIDFPLRAYATDIRGRRAWGRAGPVVRWIVGKNPPLPDDTPEDLRSLFEPLGRPLLPAAVEPKWKVWKRRELRRPESYRSALGRRDREPYEEGPITT